VWAAFSGGRDTHHDDRDVDRITRPREECIVSTTLMPPSFYEVSSQVCPARLYRTLAAAAVAIARCAPERAEVCVVTGSRRRRLSERETQELASRFARVDSSPNATDLE
jgi:hypothetical protein